MKKFTVFANFFIDTEERFLRLKDSFFSFKDANINEWIINIRGQYKERVKEFLKNNIKKKLKIFFLESQDGWIEDSIKITQNIETKIIFIWIEDHICVQPFSKINQIVKEMEENEIDHLVYSFFHKGGFLKPLEVINFKKTQNISYFLYNKENHNKIKEWFGLKKSIPNYLITVVSFMSLDLFKKNLYNSKSKKKYNKMIPFNFEKNFFEDSILPFNNGILNEELFVSIDDDHGEEGYSLISRRKYPCRVSKKELDQIRDEKNEIFHRGRLKEKIKKLIFFFKR